MQNENIITGRRMEWNVMFALKVKFMNVLLYSDPRVSGQLGTKAASSELRRSGPSLGIRVLQLWQCLHIFIHSLSI